MNRDNNPEVLCDLNKDSKEGGRSLILSATRKKSKEKPRDQNFNKFFLVRYNNHTQKQMRTTSLGQLDILGLDAIVDDIQKHEHSLRELDILFKFCTILPQEVLDSSHVKDSERKELYMDIIELLLCAEEYFCKFLRLMKVTYDTRFLLLSFKITKLHHNTSTISFRTNIDSNELLRLKDQIPSQPWSNESLEVLFLNGLSSRPIEIQEEIKAYLSNRNSQQLYSQTSDDFDGYRGLSQLKGPYVGETQSETAASLPENRNMDIEESIYSDRQEEPDARYVENQSMNTDQNDYYTNLKMRQMIPEEESKVMPRNDYFNPITSGQYEPCDGDFGIFEQTTGNSQYTSNEAYADYNYATFQISNQHNRMVEEKEEKGVNEVVGFNNQTIMTGILLGIRDAPTFWNLDPAAYMSRPQESFLSQSDEEDNNMLSCTNATNPW